MTSRRPDIILSTILLLVSALWCWGVLATIPGAEDGSRLGALEIRTLEAPLAQRFALLSQLPELIEGPHRWE